jgi:hypothetical protein
MSLPDRSVTEPLDRLPRNPAVGLESFCVGPSASRKGKPRRAAGIAERPFAVAPPGLEPGLS